LTVSVASISGGAQASVAAINWNEDI